MKKGISLIALMATITILLILVTTVTISGIQSADNAKRTMFATEISNLQESVDAYKLKNNGDYPTKDIVSVNLGSVSANSITQFNGEKISNSTLSLYEIDYDKLNITSLRYGNKTDGDNDVYALSQDTGRVYYVKGLNVGSKTYFTLTDDLKQIINYSTNTSDTQVNDGIVYVASNTDWTNSNVNVDVKIPKTYVDVSVKINSTGNALSPSSTSDPTYTIYSVNGITGNYEIDIAYKVNSSADTKTSKYNVKNVDTVSPTITLDTANQKLMKSDNGDSYAYVNVLTKSDDLSGIKLIKYESEKIDSAEVSNYFKSNGKQVDLNSNVIPIDKDAQYETIYAEDNAGNWTVVYLTVSSDVYSGLLK